MQNANVKPQFPNRGYGFKKSNKERPFAKHTFTTTTTSNLLPNYCYGKNFANLSSHFVSIFLLGFNTLNGGILNSFTSTRKQTDSRL